MKILAILFTTFVFFSCSNDSAENHEKNQEHFNISNTEILKVFVAEGMPVEGGISITTHPKHSVVSEIQHQESGVVYVYEPKEGFTGNDYIEITSNHSDGARVYSKTITAITVTVSE